jgi:SOS-response transcriptional repressor LexA
MLSQKIKEKRKEAGLLQTDLAKATGVSLKTVGRWESGEREPGAEELRKISVALNASVDYLLTEGTDELSSTSEVSSYRDYDVIKLPVLSMESVVCAGEGFSLEDVVVDFDTWEYISREGLGPIDETRKPFIVRVEGDSMEGAGIYNGAKVVINPAMEISDGDPAMICYGLNHENAIKWVYWLTNGGVEIRSANPRYKPRFFDKEERELGFFFVVGKVVMVITKPLKG